MVSGFCNVSKIVILFNCGVVHPGYSECLSGACNKLLTAARHGLFDARGVVVGVLTGSVNCGGTASPTRKNGGGIAGEV